MDRKGKRDNSYDKNESNSKMRRKKRVCAFCTEDATSIDYKDTSKMRKYISERGKILPRRISGCCALHQRMLTEAVKRARHIALIPYSAD